MKQNKKTNTKLLTKEEAIGNRKWLVFDATGKVLGRFASEIAKVLRGKHKVSFTPHEDGGDGVIIINADKIRVTGKKEDQKVYHYYTGHIGGLREVPFAVMKARKPDYIIRRAVEGMMPKTRLSKQSLRRLRIFAGSEHDMQAQTPTVVQI